MKPVESETVDAVCELLANTRRRTLLYELQTSDVTTVDELTRTIAAAETGEPGAEPSDGDLKSVRVDLVHHHLPKLEDFEVLEYDGRNGDVVRRERFEDLEPFLERSRELERDFDATRVEPAFGN